MLTLFKKIIALLLFFVIFNQEAKSQLNVGDVAPDFTLTDINGNNHNLYSVLDSGYTVVLNFFAVWSSPDWNYHSNPNNLSKAWTDFGPGGTDQIRIFMIEGDGSSTISEINGIGAGTQGNWVTGTNFPIILSSNVTFPNVASDYAIGYFPTIYTICPNRLIKDEGQKSATQLLPLINSCPFIANLNTDASIVKYKGQTSSCINSNINLNVRIQNMGLNPLNSAIIQLLNNNVVVKTHNWNGNLGTYEIEDVNMGTYSNPLSTSDFKFNIIANNDSNHLNDSLLNSGIVFSSTVLPNPILKISIKTDKYNSESSWKIKNSSNVVVAQKTSFASALTVYDTVITLPLALDCYRFEMYDSYGDGLIGDNTTNTMGYLKLYTSSDQLIDSITSFTNTYTKPMKLGANNNFSASGKVFLDQNQNQIYDSGVDQPISGAIVSNSRGWNLTSDINGNYEMFLDSGFVNEITINSNLLYTTQSPLNHSITPTILGSQGSNFNFSVELIPNMNDLELDFANGIARPGFNHWSTFMVKNVGTTNITNATLKVLIPDTFILSNSYPSYSQIIGDTLIWNNITINSNDFKIFDLNSVVPMNILFGGNYTFKAWIEPITSDLTPNNNELVYSDLIMGSFDPNDKTVSDEILEPLTLNKELKYTIRFQNTGNDTAFTVIIRDTLSQKVDLSTFRIIGASHPYTFSLIDRALEVKFSNILLVDSFANEPQSHGFVKYGVKPNQNLGIGENIDNTAFIFFDFNLPVSTNTTTTQIVTTSIDGESYIQANIYPNPNNGKIKVSLIEINSAILKICDLNGKELLIQNIQNDSEINLNLLNSGIYFGTIYSKNGNKHFKIIKE